MKEEPPPIFHIPLIKRSVQTSELLYATNTHRRKEPTCGEQKHEREGAETEETRRRHAGDTQAREQWLQNSQRQKTRTTVEKTIMKDGNRLQSRDEE